MVMSVSRQNGDDGTPKQETTPTRRNKRRGSTLYETSFATTEHARQLDLSVNDMQAFLQFPIGLDNSKRVMLRGLYATGGCYNMGWKSYHLEIAKRHPELVKQVLDLEKVQHENIKIGAIKDAVEIDSIIEYYLPYQDQQGDNHTLMIGLAETLPINTLYGLPFILKAKLVPFFHRNACTRTSQLFKEEYELNMETPGRYPVENLHIGM